MTLPFRLWLPDGAATPPAAQRALADMIESWSGEWFAGEPMRVAGALARIAAPRGELRKAVWHSCDEGLAIGLPPAGAMALGAMVLGVPAAAGQRNAHDQALLEALGKDCLDGLKSRLVQCLALGRPVWHQSEAGRGEGPVHRLEIVTATRGLTLQIELSAPVFARFVREALPEPAIGAPLGSGRAALADIPVSLSALLGRSRITVAELAGLGCGDVLVLDRATDDILPLAVDGVPLARGRCAVVEGERGPALEIVEAPTR
ncbi:MAG: FliM/FliN family flagellar motor switch protein [Sphingomonas sp.]|uniref:FliM/FliN family flagellar motor C-terminal domain-containing protein n=1 Tax=Alphaproteobacteria TaxID=28211 RepID=UPI002455DBF7|nr:MULTISPECIES: FliM/FliN family flagellar motor C-terminal domain-containing protein [Alphaproteobacteria]MBQ1496684.1 FliM/FliN family flagellar motor switch protein [Sphingomonas sp.]MBR3193817.1 FliM/FliN family flagellar motor switch protein [Bosea sp. (in: a-proteobacteria)]MDH4744532.1 FliM/FliN family flagellar motor C-terminal domain-containing protein [Sphingomonas sp. CBMAI 2297]